MGGGHRCVCVTPGCARAPRCARDPQVCEGPLPRAHVHVTQVLELLHDGIELLAVLPPEGEGTQGGDTVGT